MMCVFETIEKTCIKVWLGQKRTIHRLIRFSISDITRCIAMRGRVIEYCM